MIRRDRTLVIALCMTVALFTTHARAWEIKLNLTENWGQGGLRHVCGGVPLLPGQAMKASELRLWTTDRGGNPVEVPAQFRVLARYWRGDNSIRWVLVDLAAKVRKSDTVVYFLRPAKDAAAAVPEQAVSVTKTDERLMIDTGPARFELSRRNFAFLDKVVVDGVELIESTPEAGSVVEDTFGNKYYSSAGTESVEVIEEGPLRVRVRARGRHVNPDGKGYSKGMYMFDVFMDFFAGSRAVKVDYVVCNNAPESIGEPTFEDASLLLRYKNGAGGYTAYGSSPISGGLQSGQLTVYQDSNGAESWQVCQGYSGRGPGGTGFPKGSTVSFKGYRILQRTEEKGEVILSSGDRTRGTLVAGERAGGVAMHSRDFWQQFPKAASVNAEGMLRFGAFPRECKVPFYLEDGSGKGYEIYYLFYAKSKPCGYAMNARGRPYGHVFADSWEYPVFPRPDLEHIAATGALTDIGPSSVPKSFFVKAPVGGVDYEMEIRNRRRFMADAYWGNGFGWQVFGSSWQAFGGHSTKGARQPIKEDFYLYRWYWTGSRNWLTAGNRRSRNFRDVRNYRIEGIDALSFGDRKTFSRTFNCEGGCTRPQPDNAEIQKFSEGRFSRNKWLLPNNAHMTMDLVYDRYLLFGDQRAFENMRIIAGHGATLAAYAKAETHRRTGWSWRALERYWELTGDPLAQQRLDDIIKLQGSVPIAVAGPTKRKAKSGKINWWFTQIFSRAAAMTALHYRDPRALRICKELDLAARKAGKGATEDNAFDPAYFCTLYAVLYHLTGDDQYKQMVLTDGKGENLLKACTFGDFPATAHWLFFQPPNPLKPGEKRIEPVKEAVPSSPVKP